jgi:hypothetical protein
MVKNIWAFEFLWTKIVKVAFLINQTFWKSFKLYSENYDPTPRTSMTSGNDEQWGKFEKKKHG